MKHRFYRVTATWFGAGLAPVAPGTFGSLAALPVGALAAWHWGWGIAAALVLFAVSIPSARYVADEMDVKDPGLIVIDEAVGMTIACIGIGLTPLNLLLAFLIFRFFDILKPPPCRQLEALPGGWGIVLDDVMAGIYTLVVMRLIAMSFEL